MRCFAFSANESLQVGWKYENIWKLWSNPKASRICSQMTAGFKQSAASSATDLKLLLFCRAYVLFFLKLSSWACSIILMGLGRLCCKILAWSTKKLAKNWVAAMALAYCWWTKSCLHRDMCIWLCHECHELQCFSNPNWLAVVIVNTRSLLGFCVLSLRPLECALLVPLAVHWEASLI